MKQQERAKFGELLLSTSRLLKVMQESGGLYDLLEIWHGYLFPDCSIYLRHLGVVLYIIHDILICKLRWLLLLHINLFHLHDLFCSSGSNMEGNISFLTSALCNSELIHLAGVSCRRPCSSVWSPLTQTPRHSTRTSMRSHVPAHTRRFAAIRVIWCELAASHGSNQ